MTAAGSTSTTRVGIRVVAVLTAIVIGFLAFRLGRSSVSAAPHSVVFTGTIASVYASGQGGCVAADAGQGLSRAKDAYCGPFFLGEGIVKPGVGDAVTATPFTTTATDGQDISGLLLAHP